MPHETPKLALSRAYRPRDFSDLVGQDHVQRTILNALKSGRASHAYLFSGPRGTGKTTTARLVAKGLLCPELLDQGNDATSPAWEDILAGRHLDLIEIDAASNRGIDEIRDLREKVRFSPSQGPKKVFIIDEVHMLTTEAFNALLKTLEEPPAHAHFVLATTELHKIPATIVSRCQHFEFRRIPDEVIVARLRDVAAKEGISMDDDAFPLIAHAAQGALRDALVLLEQVAAPGVTTTKQDIQEMLGLSHVDAVNDFLVALFSGDRARCLGLIHELYARGGDLAAFIRDLISTMRKRMVSNVLGNSIEAVPFELAAIRAFERALLDQKIAGVPELPLELAVLELVPAGGAAHSPTASPAAATAASAPQDTEEASGPVDIGARWNGVLAAVKNPATRLAARKARVHQPDAATVELLLGNKFEYEKLAGDAARHDLEDAVLATTGKRVRVIPRHEPAPVSAAPGGADPMPLDELESFFGGAPVV